MFLERFNWIRNAHAKCEWYHPVGWGLRLNKKEEASWAPVPISLCFLTTRHAPVTIARTILTAMASSAWWTASSWVKMNPSYLQLFSVRYSATVATKNKQTKKEGSNMQQILSKVKPPINIKMPISRFCWCPMTTPYGMTSNNLRRGRAGT